MKALRGFTRRLLLSAAVLGAGAAVARADDPPSQAAAVLADATTSSAVTMQPGETYIGAGPITVGYLGAKKQLVLPNGRWLLLSAAVLGAGAAVARADDPPSQAAAVLADATTSSAVTMQPGEIYIGAGPITVGYLGAKKQLVLPNGRWLLLASGDRPSLHPVPVALTTMVFAQFDAGQPASLLVYQFNGRVGSPQTRWTDLDHCVRQDGPRGAQKLEHSASGGRRLCGWVVREARVPEIKDPIVDRALAVLQQLGTPQPQGSCVFSRAFVGDNGVDYLGLRRIDFDAGRRLDVAQRSAWLAAYAGPMVDGYARKVGFNELDPGQPPRGAFLGLPD